MAANGAKGREIPPVFHYPRPNDPPAVKAPAATRSEIMAKFAATEPEG